MKRISSFKKQREEKAIQKWYFGDCSLCHSQIYFIFNKENVYIQRSCCSTCECISMLGDTTGLAVSSWEAVANQYNYCFKDEKMRKEYDDFWGFNHVPLTHPAKWDRYGLLCSQCHESVEEDLSIYRKKGGKLFDIDFKTYLCSSCRNNKHHD